jgi:hypothetical protein
LKRTPLVHFVQEEKRISGIVTEGPLAATRFRGAIGIRAPDALVEVGRGAAGDGDGGPLVAGEDTGDEDDVADVVGAVGAVLRVIAQLAVLA